MRADAPLPAPRTLAAATLVKAVRQGRVLSELPHTDGLHLATAHNVPVALMELSGGTAKVVRGFNLPDVAE